MLISNFNVCKTEWLDLVFDKRNKEYGAYLLRQQYANNVIKAMLITFVSVVALTVLTGKLIAVKPESERWTEVELDKIYITPPLPPKKVEEPPKPRTQTPAAASGGVQLANTQALPPPVVTADPVDNDIPVIDDNTNVGQTTITNGVDGAAGGLGIEGGTGTEGAGIETAGPDAGPMLAAEKMPEPMNGMQSWTKFLQNTIRYPGVASSNGVSGKVLVSFIVEKDGHLSSFKVERGQGYGLDEEALRVLKLAKPWKPGMQNGRAVRVKLTLPIAFLLEEN